MYGSTVFDVNIDFQKSHGSYLFDKKRGQYFLDFFSFWSSLPLGYNHQIFEREFTDAISQISKIKVATNAIETDEGAQFLERFSKCPGMDIFKYFHFCCTGALAIEAALKTAIEYRGSKTPVVISFRGSFHGDSCWGLATDRFPPIDLKLEACPEVNWPKVSNVDEIEEFMRENGTKDIAAILVEPIQSTFGDRYFPTEFFTRLKGLCDDSDICLIFDEIQTGFGVTGKMWYYQYLNIEPDIVVFGKKSQVAGIMAKERFGSIFESPLGRLEVTFDGELIDMVRCFYIMEAYDRFNILANVNEKSAQLYLELKDVNSFRCQGLLAAFDLPTPELKDKFARVAFENQLLVNPGSYNCIRLRPNLNVSAEEVHEAAERIKKSLGEL